MNKTWEVNTINNLILNSYLNKNTKLSKKYICKNYKPVEDYKMHLANHFS